MNRSPERPRRPTRPPVEDADAATLPYTVETSPAGDAETATVLARLHSLAVAQATWAAAAEERPGARVVLRQGDRILRHSGPA